MGRARTIALGHLR